MNSFFFLCMIVLSLDFDALSVLFLKPLTLAVKGEHVGKCLVTEIWAAALALGSFANGVQVTEFSLCSLASGEGRRMNAVDGFSSAPQPELQAGGRVAVLPRWVFA